MNTYYIAGFPVGDELYHHGIKDQKWGIRRFQNPDGTLTPAGRERYYGHKNQNRNTSSFKKTVSNVAAKYKQHVVNTIKKNHPWLMDDDELVAVLNRMSMEQKIRNIRKDEKSSRLVNKAAKQVGGILKTSGDIVVSNIKDFGRDFSKTAGKGIAEYLFSDKNNDNNNNKNKKNNKKDTEKDTENNKDTDDDYIPAGHGKTTKRVVQRIGRFGNVSY